MKSTDKPDDASATDSAAAANPTPTNIVRGLTDDDILRKLRVVDAKTGEQIDQVIEADAVAGTLSRFELDGDGNFVRKNDAFNVVTEERAIRFEWIEQAAG